MKLVIMLMFFSTLYAGGIENLEIKIDLLEKRYSSTLYANESFILVYLHNNSEDTLRVNLFTYNFFILWHSEAFDDKSVYAHSNIASGISAIRGNNLKSAHKPKSKMINEMAKGDDWQEPTPLQLTIEPKGVFFSFGFMGLRNPRFASPAAEKKAYDNNQRRIRAGRQTVQVIFNPDYRFGEMWYDRHTLETAKETDAYRNGIKSNTLIIDMEKSRYFGQEKEVIRKWRKEQWQKKAVSKTEYLTNIELYDEENLTKDISQFSTLLNYDKIIRTHLGNLISFIILELENNKAANKELLYSKLKAIVFSYPNDIVVKTIIFRILNKDMDIKDKMRNDYAEFLKNNPGRTLFREFLEFNIGFEEFQKISKAHDGGLQWEDL